MSEESIQQMKYRMRRLKIVSYHCIFLTLIFDTRKFLLYDVSSVFLMDLAHLYTGSRRIQGVSEETVNILGAVNMDCSE
jgi:hypothetical protein